jgi:hypothetical protein
VAGRRFVVSLALACLAVLTAGVAVVWTEPGPSTPVEQALVPPVLMTPVVVELPTPEPDPEPVEEEEPDPLPTSPETRARFEERYPAQAEAVRGSGAGQDHWALLVGINQHLGAVSDNYVSREDAELLRELLLDAGWDDERIVLMTDTDATGTMIREGLSWLARKAGDDATVVLHFSGHSKKWYGDGGAILDMALWPTDDDFVRRTELAEALEVIPHGRLWGNFATCNAEGLHEAGLGDDRRVFTYSSRTAEKSYEDPNAGNSVWGRFFLNEVLAQHDATTTQAPLSVQQAFAAAGPRATERTATQVPYGPQTPVLHDGLGEPFALAADGDASSFSRLLGQAFAH